MTPHGQVQKERAEQEEWERFLAQFKDDPARLERVRSAFKFLADFIRNEG